MAELLDIHGAFAHILETPEQKREKQMAQNLGMFQSGWAGTLAESRTNFQNNMRSSLQKAGSAINPDFDIRTNDDKFRAAINAIDGSSEDAEAQYIEAAKKFKPSKLPALMDSIRTRRREDEADGRANAAEGRAAAAGTRAEEVHNNLVAGWETAERQRAIQLELSEMQLDSATSAVDRVETQKNYLLTTVVGKGEGYAQRLEGMSPQEVATEFARVEAIEGQVAKGLRTQIKAVLGDDHDVIKLLKDMPASQLQSIQASIASGFIKPDTQIIGDRENGYQMVITDPTNPTQTDTVDILGGTGPKIAPRSVQPLTGATREAVDNAVGKIDMAEWSFGRGSVSDPQGADISGEDLIRQRAGDYFQRNKVTELELTDKVRRAAAELEGLEAGKETYASLNSVLNKYFPRPSAESLLDSQ